MIKLSGITAEADREFFQRGGCESVRVEGTQGQRKRGGRSVMVRVRVRVRVIHLNQTGIRHQILGGVGVRVMHSRSDAPSSNPTHSILNCFFP